jgi:putative hemolysin
VRGLAEGVLEVDGAVSVRDLNADHALGLPESPEYVTVAGLVLARLGAIPREDEIVELPGGLRIRVLGLDGRRVARVRLEKQARETPAAG